MNLEHHRKQSRSLHRAYLLVGVVGVFMLVFILINYINVNRLNELTSTLWTAIREVELEATAVQHEANDLLCGEFDPAAETLWFYLDQSIWHLANLLESYRQHHRSWLFSGKLDASGLVKEIDEHLVQLKAFFKPQQGHARSPEAVSEMIMRLDELFAAFRFQLEEAESDISRIMIKEQLHQRISYAVLGVFCVAMIAFVTYQIRRYERYRKESYETVNRANAQLARQIEERQRVENDLCISYEFMKIANGNREIEQILSQFTASIQLYTGCSQCTIRLLSDNGTLEGDQSPFSDPDGMGCELDINSLKSNLSMCARVLNNDVDPSLPWFTPFGSYFLHRFGQDGGSADPDPESCEQHQCARMGYRSLALIHIKLGEQVLGLILIADAAEGLLNRVMVELVETAAMQVGAAIWRLRVEEGLETAYHELENRVSERTQPLSEMNRELQSEIEERRLAEARLRKNRNTLQTLIDGISDSLILVDMAMRIRMLNRVAAKTFHVDSLDSVIGKLCYQEIGPAASCADCAIPLAVKRRENLTFERQGVAVRVEVLQ